MSESITPIHPRRATALAGAAIVAIGASAIALSGGPADGSGWSLARAGYELAWWALAGVALWWALVVQRQPAAAWGLRRPTWGAALWAVAFALAAILIFGVCQFWLFPKLGLTDSRAHVAAIRKEPIGLTLIIALRAGVVEEWLFRFFAIGELAVATGRRWIGAILAGLLFIALHAANWQWVHLLPVALVTILFTAIYWWRGNLFINAAAHFLTDFVPALLALLIAAHHG